MRRNCLKFVDAGANGHFLVPSPSFIGGSKHSTLLKNKHVSAVGKKD